VSADAEGASGERVAARAEAEAREHEGNNVPLALWGLAIVATIAAILSRAIEPALLGVWERSDHIIHAVRLGAAGGSQLAAVGSSALVVGLVLAAVRHPIPSYLRAFAIGVGMLTLLALALSAVAVTLPDSSRLVVASAASLLALLAAREPARLFLLRAAALVVASTAASGFVRVATIGVMTYAPEGPGETWGVLARALATLGWAVDLATVLLAAAILVTTAPRGNAAGKTRVRWPLLAVVVVVPLLLVAGAQLGAEPERSGFPVLLANVARLLQIYPEPYIPGLGRSALEMTRWVTAAGILVVMPRGRMTAATLALALCAAGTVEAPLCAAALVVAALALALHPTDTRSVDQRRPG
jgi:hypothetical protein